MKPKPFAIVDNLQNELPNNIEAEQAVLGSILVSNEIFDDVSSYLNPEKFFDPIHNKIFLFELLSFMNA